MDVRKRAAWRLQRVALLADLEAKNQAWAKQGDGTRKVSDRLFSDCEFNIGSTLFVTASVLLVGTKISSEKLALRRQHAAPGPGLPRNPGWSDFTSGKALVSFFPSH